MLMRWSTRLEPVTVGNYHININVHGGNARQIGRDLAAGIYVASKLRPL